jgi:NAD(P)-dependent dehydrogenase (short-subunit alcohol dehydrogenase family)
MMQTSKDKPYPSGSIIGTASSAGMRSKAAVISIMQTTCYQLVGTGIRCNALCPGVIETGMTSKMYEAARARGTEKSKQTNEQDPTIVSDIC